MKIDLIISALLLFAPMVWCVRVTLEGGATDRVDKEVDVDQPTILACGFTPSKGSGQGASITWTSGPTEAAIEDNLIVFAGVVENAFVPQFSIQPPASLQIQSALVKNAGFYECRVTIPNDGVDSGMYNLTVLVPPSPPHCQFTSDYAITLGFSAEFKCYSDEGIPAPTYQWFKNGQALPLTNQGSPQYANTSFSFNAQTGTLTFAKVVPGDAGSYYCSATNKRGTGKCDAVVIKTKDQDVGMIVGIVFGVIFGLLLIGVLIWWTWKKGYCDGFMGKDDDDDVDGDDANDIMLDGNGPTVNKPPSEFNGSTTGKHPPDGAVRVMP